MLHQPDENGVYARIYAAPMRRLFAYVMLLGLGALLLWLVFTAPPTAGWALVMVLIALGALYLAERMRRATATVLELTADELRDSTGRVLARVEDIEKIDRGVFAFKTSKGFVLKNKL
jgi:membrane protein implicated in regulation of membrane protease activity